VQWFGPHARFTQLRDVQRIANVVRTLAGKPLTLARESASHVSPFISSLHAYIGILQFSASNANANG
jgi:hypothetical protein